MLNRHFSPFKLLVHLKSKTLFVLNPKVMTSFTRQIILDALKEFGEGTSFLPSRFLWLNQARSFPLQPLSFYARLAFGQSDFRVFALARNPYSRTFSAWKDKFYDPHVKGGGVLSAYPRSMQQGVLRDFRRFATRHGLEGGSENSLLPFSTFLSRIEAQKAGERNHHWDSQKFVLQAQHFNFDKIYKMETEREECFKVVFGRMGFSPDWIASKISNSINKSSVSQSKLISEGDIKKIDEIFNADFDFLGYDRSVPRSLYGYLKN